MSQLDFRSMMSLEPHGPDTFVATGPQYPWGGLYGGQIIAQGPPDDVARVSASYTGQFLRKVL